MIEITFPVLLALHHQISTIGAPRGSIFGRILFKVYDHSECVGSIHVPMFVDDIALYHASLDNDELGLSLPEDLQSLVEFKVQLITVAVC